MLMGRSPVPSSESHSTDRKVGDSAGGKVSRATSIISFSSAALSSVLLLALVGVLVTDVFLRNAFNEPLTGTVPWVEVLLVSFAALSLAPTALKGGHISVQVLMERLPVTVRKWCELTTHVLLIALLTWMVYGTASAAVTSFQRGETRVGIVNVPAWPARVFITIGLVLLLIFFLERLLMTLPRRLQEEKHGR